MIEKMAKPSSIILFLLLLALLVLAGYGIYRHYNPKTIEVIKTVEIPVPKVVVKKVPVVKKEIKYIKVYEKQKLLEAVKNLPPEVIKDEKVEVSAIGEVKTRTGKEEIISTVNMETGENKLLKSEVRQPLRAELILSPYIEARIAGSSRGRMLTAGVQLDAVRLYRNTVVYVKAETGLTRDNEASLGLCDFGPCTRPGAWLESHKDSKPYHGIYVGIRHEIDLMGRK